MVWLFLRNYNKKLQRNIKLVFWYLFKCFWFMTFHYTHFKFLNPCCILFLHFLRKYWETESLVIIGQVSLKLLLFVTLWQFFHLLTHKNWYWSLVLRQQNQKFIQHIALCHIKKTYMGVSVNFATKELSKQFRFFSFSLSLWLFVLQNSSRPKITKWCLS